MSGIERHRRIILNITTSSGSGSKKFTLTGRIVQLSVQPPGSTSETVNWDIEHEDGEKVDLRTGVGAPCTMEVDRVVDGNNTFSLTSATQDGSWRIVLYAEFGV